MLTGATVGENFLAELSHGQPPFRINYVKRICRLLLTANNQLQKQMPLTPTNALFVCDLPIHKKRTTHRPMPSSTPARTVDGFPSFCLFETLTSASRPQGID